MATDAQKLVEAQTAYHSLMIGGAVRVVVDQNGERVEYTAANAASLLKYINDLIASIAGITYPGNRPAGVVF